MYSLGYLKVITVNMIKELKETDKNCDESMKGLTNERKN